MLSIYSNALSSNPHWSLLIFVGPWWWSSCQRAFLLLQCSEFESPLKSTYFCWTIVMVKLSACTPSTPTLRVRIPAEVYLFFCNKLSLKRMKINKRGRGWPILKQKSIFVRCNGAICIRKQLKVFLQNANWKKLTSIYCLRMPWSAEWRTGPTMYHFSGLFFYFWAIPGLIVVYFWSFSIKHQYSFPTN